MNNCLPANLSSVLPELKELLDKKDAKGRMVSEVKQLEKKMQDCDVHLKKAQDQIDFNHKVCKNEKEIKKQMYTKQSCIITHFMDSKCYSI